MSIKTEVKFSVEDLRKIYCTNYETFLEIFNFPNNDYGESKFHLAHRDLAEFLCQLDLNNQRVLYNYLNK